MPISIFLTDIFIFSLALLWLFDGDWLKKWQKIKSSSWMISLGLLFLIYILALFYGTWHTGAIWVFQKSAILLLLPILYTFEFSQKEIKSSILSFLCAMLISSIIALMINFKWLKPLFKYSELFAKNWSISAFMPYTDHNVFLAFAILISLVLILNNIHHKKALVLLIICISIFAFSLFNEKGRAGQLGFVFAFSLFSVFVFWHKKIWMALSFLVIITMLISAYYYSSSFNSRIHDTFNQLSNLQQDQSNSINTRYYLNHYSFKKIAQNPILGYGTGSFVEEFSSISQHAKSILNGVHKTSHNNYLFIWFELGIIGLLIFLSIFYFQIKVYLSKPMGSFRIIMPLLFLLLMLFDSYFQNHNSAVLYVYLSYVFSSYSFT